MNIKKEELKAWFDTIFESFFEKVMKKMEDTDEYPELHTDLQGNKIWLNKEGQLHRLDGPAVEKANGTKSWYVNGKLHREDGPAIEWAGGSKEWWLNGVRQPDQYPPTCNVDQYGNKRWKNIKGEHHREDGPAIEWANGDKEWWIYGDIFGREKKY